MESTLIIRGSRPETVFGVFGSDENTITYALSWVLSQSPQLMRDLLQDLRLPEVPSVQINAQKSAGDRGFTDLEILAGAAAHVVIEAKVGWQLPSITQLQRYAPRLAQSGTAHPLFLTVSAMSQTSAGQNQPALLGGVPIQHRSWADIQRLARQSYSTTSSHHEKLWLDHLIRALSEYRTMQPVSSNLVLVVSLSYERVRDNNPFTLVDVIEQHHCYYHPVAMNGWPPEPPNYVGFRYGGQLQSVHHIEHVTIARDLTQVNPLWSDVEHDHFVYTLGPAMRPVTRLPTGPIYRNGRKWVALDLLLSGAATSIHDAAEKTALRLAAADQAAP